LTITTKDYDDGNPIKQNSTRLEKLSKIYLSAYATFEVNGQTVWKETEHRLFF
jgi:hypothetical protein